MKAKWILGALLIGVLPNVHAQRTGRLAPIVDHYGMVLGASRDGKWISAEKTHALLKKGEKYRFYTAQKLVHTAVGSSPELSEASGQAYYIRFPGIKETQSEDTIGVGGDWNPLPRLSHAENANQAVYLGEVAALLKSKGLTGANPNITRVVRVDLLGKGQDAVLIEAATPNFKLASGFEGDAPVPNTYSCVILRMLKDGKPVTTLLGGAFYKKKGPAGPVEQYEIENVLDLNGDGVLEIVVRSHYYEGGGSAIFDVKSGTPVKVLDAADGA